VRFSRQQLLGAPAVVFSILPFGGCPACWPVYAGVLSAVGLNFLLSREYLFSLTVVFLFVAVASLIVKRRHGYAPFALGLAAASLILIGKFAITSDA
jgi:mercuric ion transport protein